MTQPIAGTAARKTARRIRIIDGVMDALMSQSVFGIIGNGRNEAAVAHKMHSEIVKSLTSLHRELDTNAPEALVEKRARECLLWEGDINTTINHIQFLGAQHRPDFIVQIDEIRIAIELKRGSDGSCVRNALGQCIVYASQFDFSCCVIVDTTRDKKLSRAYGEGTTEALMLDRLWDQFNIRIGVV
jgi:hypothetical protein